MNIIELQLALQNLGISGSYYSLNCGEKPMALILNKNETRWEIFYIDERGNKDKSKIFLSESEACEYMLNLFQKYIREKYIVPDR